MEEDSRKVGERMMLPCNNNVTIRTSRKFEAANRQIGDVGKCGKLHGHNWKVDVEIDGYVTSDIGYLVDFKDIYDVIDTFDHTTMLRDDDPLVRVLVMYGQKVEVLPVNATCENLGYVIANRLEVLLSKRHTKISRLKVVVHENDHSSAVVDRSYKYKVAPCV